MYLTEYADYNHKLILHIPYLQHGRPKTGEHGDAEQQTNLLQGKQGKYVKLMHCLHALTAVVDLSLYCFYELKWVCRLCCVCTICGVCSVCRIYSVCSTCQENMEMWKWRSIIKCQKLTISGVAYIESQRLHGPMH